MTYEQYLFSQLLCLYDTDFSLMEYDRQYQETIERYKVFTLSPYNQPGVDLYSAITYYLSDKYN
jgi:hypothetical protein